MVVFYLIAQIVAVIGLAAHFVLSGAGFLATFYLWLGVIAGNVLVPFLWCTCCDFAARLRRRMIGIDGTNPSHSEPVKLRLVK